jgi:hypothetical protein
MSFIFSIRKKGKMEGKGNREGAVSVPSASSSSP